MLRGWPEESTVIALSMEEIQQLKEGYPVVLYGDTSLTVIFKEEHNAKMGALTKKGN